MKLRITVHGVAYEVDVEVLDDPGGLLQVPAQGTARAAAPSPRPAVPPAQGPAAATVPAASAAGDGIVAPLAGTVVKIHAEPGKSVTADEPLLVLEAMKMNTVISSDRAGVVKEIHVKEGETVRDGQLLVSFRA